MAVRQQQIETPYVPLPVTGGYAGGVSLASLEQELARISAAMGTLFSGGAAPSELAGLVGVPTSLTLGTVRAILQAYGAEFISSTFLGEVADATGTIEIRNPGLYRVTASAQGDQGNTAFNEAAFMFLRRSDGAITDFDLAGYEIPNNKTTSRSWNATRLISVSTVPAVFSLGLYATAALGTFTFQQASFDIAAYKIRTKG